MGSRRFPVVEIKPKEVEPSDLYFAAARLAVMATAALAVVFLMR